MVSAGLSSVNENDQETRKKGGLLLAFLENLSGYTCPPIGKTDLLTRIVAELFGSPIDRNFCSNVRSSRIAVVNFQRLLELKRTPTWLLRKRRLGGEA